MLLGCSKASSHAAMIVDDGAAREIQGDFCTTALVPLSLRAGEHRIDVASLRASVKFDAQPRFLCRPGETLYGASDLQFKDSNQFRTEWNASLTMIDAGATAASAPLARHGLAIWVQGHWLVEPEPTSID